MKIEEVRICNFRCFGPEWTTIHVEPNLTALVGGNGSGKTAFFLALSRIFGVTASQRSIQRRDFHVPLDAEELESGASLAIDVVLGFPELTADGEGRYEDAVPEYFLQMAATEPGGPLQIRMQLRATWTEDGTPDGTVEEDLRWITTVGGEYVWEECSRVQPYQRGTIQLIYVPAARDASSQVTGLLKGRIWQAARWSEEFQQTSASSSEEVQDSFEAEEPARLVAEHLACRWAQLNAADTDTTPRLKLIESRFEELIRKAEVVFHPDEEGHERALAELSDGQRSLFHIALTAATLEVEREAFAQPPDESPFDPAKLRRTHLTLLAIEEPENSLAPFFLARIVAQARDIGALPTAQVMLSSHSPAILSRIDPTEVRYFRLSTERRACVKGLRLPEEAGDARSYVRLAVRAHPEIYFAKFVVLGEGESERIVIPRLAEAMGAPLDPAFVPVVPLAGRYAHHFWALLSDLQIPHATLLDLDLGRRHGGVHALRNAASELALARARLAVDRGTVEGGPAPEEYDRIAVEELLDPDHHCFSDLAEHAVFFSHPLDLDFAMLRAFPDAYQVQHPGGRGPRHGADAASAKKDVSLKTGGTPDIYDEAYDQAFEWYPYLFLSRSKPDTHVMALSRLSDETLVDGAPSQLKAIIRTVQETLNVENNPG